ncbi:dipeptidase [Candidatus Latescibacterota bacterium]
MTSRREFLKRASAGGISGIIASGTVPVYAKNVRLKKTGVSIEEAQVVHDKCLIIDGHNDMPVETVARGERKLQWNKRDLAYHTDIPRMKEGGYDAGIFIVACTLSSNIWVTTELMLSEIDEHPDDLLLVLSSQDTIRAKETGKIGIIMGIEIIGHWANEEIDIVRLLYRLGVRSIGLLYMQGTKSSMKACTPAEREEYRKNCIGLIPFGFKVLKEINDLGIVCDLSHINDAAFYEVLEHSTRIPFMSHTTAFSLCNNYRALTDDQIKALASVGGAMGITFVPQYINSDPEKATIDQVVEHICYVADLVGIDHVGIGSDFDGIVGPIVPDVSQLVHLTRSMMAYGLSEEDIKKIWGGNFLRILQQNID